MGRSFINVSLTYLRGLEIAELKEEDMPMGCMFKIRTLPLQKCTGLINKTFKNSFNILKILIRNS